MGLRFHKSNESRVAHFRDFGVKYLLYLGAHSIVRTDRPGHSRRNENFTFYQRYPARSVKSSSKPLGKSLFHFQNDRSGECPAGQF